MSRRPPAPPVVFVALLAALSACIPSLADSRVAAPRTTLIVVLAVDQMRAEYAERYSSQWRAGLRRLLDRGAWFRRAAYPYMNTVTCAGHATIATGAVPAKHGMVLNEWWDRESQRAVTCTHDAAAHVVSYGPAVRGGHSSARLKVQALPDEMRAQLTPIPRVATLSIKARSAIMLAGRSGDAVTWRESGSWVTSTMFSRAPVPAVAEWVSANPLGRNLPPVWDRQLPPARYLFEETPLGRKPPEGWAPLFPHPFRAGEAPVPNLNALWQTSPFADEQLGHLAAHLVERLELGQRSSTDYLGVSFSAVDSIGHKFGPESHEVQDALVRLDATVGRLLDTLDRLVGRDRYVVALSADHGVSHVPEQLAARGQDAGRVKSPDVARRVEDALQRELGPGQYIARVFYTDVYFLPGVYDRMLASPGAMTAAIEAILATPGISRVYRADRLAAGDYAGDPFAGAARLSYHAGRSGDLILVPKPNWITSSDAATHGTAHPYDTRVPIVLLGRGIKPGQYEQAVTPADIAPTLARIAGVKLPAATGRVLTEALVTASARPAAAAASSASDSLHARD